MIVPPAILEAILQYFGDAALPDFSRTPGILARDPYRKVLQRVSQLGEVKDFTDLNSDLGCAWSISLPDGAVVARLSVVGPYAIVTREENMIQQGELHDLLSQEGFIFLSAEVMAASVTIWEPEYVASVYEMLFEFDQDLPWSRP
jgi:hypothetical protein